MGVQQRPSINAQCLRLAKFSQAIPEILPVSSIPEDLTPFNSPAYHVMQGSRRIQSRLSCHDPKLYLPKSIVNNNLHLNQRPLFPTLKNSLGPPSSPGGMPEALLQKPSI